MKAKTLPGLQKGEENQKHLAAAFACAVTVPSSKCVDWVARNGDESLFQAFYRILPEVCHLPTISSFDHIIMKVHEIKHFLNSCNTSK